MIKIEFEQAAISCLGFAGQTSEKNLWRELPGTD